MKKHPYYDPPPGVTEKVDRPRIDFDIVNVMEPMTIAGAVLGSLINKLLPGWLLTILLMIVLALITHKTLTSVIGKWRKESVHLLEEEALRVAFVKHHGREPS